LKDHPAENIYFVIEGIVLMTLHELEDVPIAIYRSGTFFGEFEVYKNTNRLFSCISIVPAKLLILDKKKFKYIFFKSDPTLGKWFISCMEKKFEKLEKVMNKVIPLATLRSIVELAIN
jgi:CRP-like cAMP-binding protein